MNSRNLKVPAWKSPRAIKICDPLTRADVSHGSFTMQACKQGSGKAAKLINARAASAQAGLVLQRWRAIRFPSLRLLRDVCIANLRFVLSEDHPCPPRSGTIGKLRVIPDTKAFFHTYIHTDKTICWYVRSFSSAHLKIEHGPNFWKHLCFVNFYLISINT